jgi:hypothetical protein
VRIEAKYHLDAGTAELLALELRASGYAVDPHCEAGPYTVSSIYLDDADFRGYVEKQDGLARRTKYRLRFYAEELGDGPVRLEHKEKDVHLSWKRVDSVRAEDVRVFAREGRGPVADLLDPGAGCVAPVIGVQYERLAFEHAVHGVRINVDTRLRWRAVEPGLPGLLSGLRCEPLAAGQAIVELKVARETAREVTLLVRRWDLHWRATPKYALCLAHMLESLAC